MARDDAPPFARGETYYNGGAIDSTNLGGDALLGREYTFEEPAGASAGRPVRVRVARNTSGIALKGKRLAVYKALDPFRSEVDGYTINATTDVAVGVIDEFLPPAGVPNNDLFYLVVGGPSVCTSVTASFVGVTPGVRVSPAAGTSKTNADAGKVTANAITTLADFVTSVGFSESTVTSDTADHDVKVVVDLGR